jgi:protein tyrosine/serine phosphatase
MNNKPSKNLTWTTSPSHGTVRSHPAIFLKVIEQDHGKKIFVHCRLGGDRTGMAIASYRMAQEGWSADEAMKEMERFGFQGIHLVICPALGHYEKEFPEHLKTNPAFKELQAAEK